MSSALHYQTLRWSLLLAALLANLWSPSVVPGVQYWLGSAFVLLATALFGPRWGWLAALASVPPLLAHEMYGLAGILLLEPLAVGAGLRRLSSENLFLVDGAFWFFVGGPLAWLLTVEPASTAIPLAELTALYQILVSLTNALLAGLLLSLTPLARWADTQRETLPLQVVLFHFVGGVALSLTLILLTLEGRSEFAEVDTEAQAVLKASSHSVGQQVAQALEDAAETGANGAQTLHEVLLTEADNQGLDMAFVNPDGTPLATTYARHRWQEMWALTATFQQAEAGTTLSVNRPVLGDFRDWVDARYRASVNLADSANDAVLHGILLLEKPLGPLLENVYRNYIRTLVAGLTILLLGLWVTWEVSRRLVQPLRQIGQVAETLPARLYEAHGPPWQPSRIREFAWLTDSVCKMDRRLRREFQTSARASERLQRAYRRLKSEIQERRAAEERVREQQNQLAHMARLSLASEMASGMAHELNQPLTAITVDVHMLGVRLRRGRLDPADAQTVLNRLSEQAMRASDIIRRLRGLVRKTEPQCRPQCLNQLILEVLALADVELRKRQIRVCLDLAEDLPPASVDNVQMQQVLLNLVRNAAEAMEDTSTDQRHLTLRTALERDQIIVRVADRGPGIPDHKIEQLFQPFHTTKDHGMGVGLWISQSLLEAHHGQLTAGHNPGGGAVFTVSVPRADGCGDAGDHADGG